MGNRLIGVGIILLIIMVPLIGVVVVSQEQTSTDQNVTTTTTNEDSGDNQGAASGDTGLGAIFGPVIESLQPGRFSSIGIMIFMLALAGVVTLYFWYFIPHWIGGKKSRSTAIAKSVRVNPPKDYDFMVYVVDSPEKTIEKDYFVKISESLYMSTNVARPTFLYIPETAETYLCREGRSVVPCGLAYREGMLTLLVDPELASAHELASSSGLISIEEDELDKLLSELYKKGEKKAQEIPITPETRIAFMFNIKNMIKSYLSILRSADEMMIHFLHTANQSESIEKFMKTAARLQSAKLSWVRWIGYFILVVALAIAMIMVIGG